MIETAGNVKSSFNTSLQHQETAKTSDKVVYFFLFLFLSEERVRVAKRKSSEYSKWANVEVRKRKAQKIICVSHLLRGSYS